MSSGRRLGTYQGCNQHQSISLYCNNQQDDILFHLPHKVHRIRTDQHQSKASCDPETVWQCNRDSDNTVVLRIHPPEGRKKDESTCLSVQCASTVANIPKPFETSIIHHHHLPQTYSSFHTDISHSQEGVDDSWVTPSLDISTVPISS